MPLYQESIFHDKQDIFDGSLNSTDSDVFVDVPGATLTTKDLSLPANYSVFMSVLVNSTANNTIAVFRALVDGNPFGTERMIFLKVKGLDVGFTFPSIADGLEAGQVLQLQFKTSAGTLNLVEYGILIDGIAQSRVVE